jgi:hypothetical protein
VVEVGHSVQVIHDELLTILYVQNGARIRYIRRSGHRYRSSSEHSSCVGLKLRSIPRS